MATRAKSQTRVQIEPVVIKPVVLVVKVKEMDHIVLRVKDIDTSIRFYNQILGLSTERLEEFKAGKVPFPSVRINGDTIIDLFKFESRPDGSIEPRNMDHYCVVVEPTDLSEVAAKLQALGVKMAPANPFRPEEKGGPFTPRWGAHGNGTSLYIYDPDENVLELRCY